ncbi:MAG: ABC transporter ATP-binding protein [Actinobacteria bacterium]|nr:ABC transporter ATP-binding protein [Actinomycetota bacterium]MCA1721728.1 ABC transporter ATP-binding protein [Actinomycetota bacterium]
MSTEFAVQASGLVKRFAHVTAVGGIELAIPRGAFFGLVGPNGAGKTTTLSMLTGLLRPDRGTVHVEGISVWTDPLNAKKMMGVVPEGFRLFERLSGRELLTYTGRLRGLPAAETEARAAELLGVFGLRPAADQLVVDYSTGMRKKIALSCALLHNPPVLFLDEPFEAVDPVSARTVRDVLTRYTARGNTVVFSSHVMELVERLCDEVAVIAGGRVVAAGEVGDLRGDRSLEDVFVDLVGARGWGQGALEWLGSH